MDNGKRIKLPVPIIGQQQPRAIQVGARHHAGPNPDQSPATQASFVHDLTDDTGEPLRIVETFGGFTKVEEAALRIYCAGIGSNAIVSAGDAVRFARRLLTLCAEPAQPNDAPTA